MKTILISACRAPLLIVALLFAFVGCNRQPVMVLPIHAIIDKHAITPGFTIAITNQGSTPMRWTVTVNRGGRITKFAPVVDNGHFFEQRGLVEGDSVTVESTGYETQTFPIK
jgi:hypothetical protein